VLLNASGFFCSVGPTVAAAATKVVLAQPAFAEAGFSISLPPPPTLHPFFPITYFLLESLSHPVVVVDVGGNAMCLSFPGQFDKVITFRNKLRKQRP
jgi:hypothetical protein